MATFNDIALSFRYWHSEMEGRALAEFALKPDATALHFNETLGDVQAQTRTR